MNISRLIDDKARENPLAVAVSVPTGIDRFGKISWKHIKRGELRDSSDQLRDKLEILGFKEGMRVLLFVRPSIEFFILVCALFKLGVVLVLIDPGMGRKNLLNAIKKVRPEGLIAVAEVFLAKLLFPRVFRSIKVSLVVNDEKKGLFSLKSIASSGVTSLQELSLKKVTTHDPKDASQINHECRHVFGTSHGNEKDFQSQEDSDEPCAILFTSGGTGTPKGVVYTHSVFHQQVRLIKQMYGITENDVDLPAFPLFALFTLSLGARVVVPMMDPTKPSKANPEKLVEAIETFQVSFAGGSPAIWENVSQYCLEKKITLPSLKSLMMFGAPVRSYLHEQFSSVLPNGTTFTPYGATECLPVSSISGREILSGLSRRVEEGTCVGLPVPDISVKIIAPTTGEIRDITEAKVLPPGEIGEIICAGPQVTKSYFEHTEANRLAKISDGALTWHRMGDLGWLDEMGRLWFCGRAVHAINYQSRWFYSVKTEAVFNRHPEVRRSALVTLNHEGKPRPAIVLERIDQKTKLPWSLEIKFREEIKALARSSQESSMISDVFLSKSFPVDIRHNIKIDRIRLGRDVSSNQRSRLL